MRSRSSGLLGFLGRFHRDVCLLTVLQISNCQVGVRILCIHDRSAYGIHVSDRKGAGHSARAAYDSSPAQSARRLFPWPVQSDPSAMSSSKLLQHCRAYYRLQQKWPTDNATTDSGSPLSNSTQHTMWQVHTPAHMFSEYHICWCSSGTLIIVSQD